MKLPFLCCLLLLTAAAAPAAAGSPDASGPTGPWPDDYSRVAPLDSCARWGTYNVHDPSCLRIGDWYYMYSTDAIYRHRGPMPGYIQMRRSRDLVDWEFVGWAFPEIPAEAVDWVRRSSGGEGATNIWAPYIIMAPDGRCRLYYCVSAFGRNTSYIGLAEADSPTGPWRQKGCVVRTDTASVANAIDPSVIAAPDGRWWLHYGSYFGGLFCVELDPATGLPLTPGDTGTLTARRASPERDNLEAPEIVYSPEQGYYYLFQSYDPLMTTYNVRVGRSRNAAGPFRDFHGRDMADTTNNFPILTAPYRFEGHPGWMGTAHCSVFAGPGGALFMAHQGRYAAVPEMMDLHVRRLFFTPDGWPVVSPERYAGVPDRDITPADIPGRWEVVRVREPRAERRLMAGQILWGEGDLRPGEMNLPVTVTLTNDGHDSLFRPADRSMRITIGNEVIDNLITFAGYDWERGCETVLFTGLDADGRSVWGKRISQAPTTATD